jgi:hypothetical protein
MHGAVTIPEMFTTIFVAELPESPDPTMIVEPGAWVEVPEDLYLWPEGTIAPQQTLCRSMTDPKVYRVFKYDKDIDRSRFVPTDTTYGGIYSREMWERFTEKLPSLRAFYAIPDDELASPNEAQLCPDCPSTRGISPVNAFWSGAR